MAETKTPEQIAYDQELAAISAMPSGVQRIKAKEAFDQKYPNGRPGGAVKTATKTDVNVREKYGIGEAL